MPIVPAPDFFRNPFCHDCPYNDGNLNCPCVSTTRLTPANGDSIDLGVNDGPLQAVLRFTPPSQPQPHTIDSTKVALLVVGEAPGYHEDQQGEPFIGQSGQLLRTRYLRPKLKKPALWDFTEHADVYLSNAVRCRPPNNATPPIGHIRKCHQYLQNDLTKLSSIYNRVVILATGATACRSLLNSSLKDALRHQPQTYTNGPHTYPVFATYHPAYLLRNRDPAKADTVVEHLQQLLRYLKDPTKTSLVNLSDLSIQEAPPSRPTKEWGNRLVIDIETYGAHEGFPEQRFMHPAQSAAFDLVSPDVMIQLVGLQWSPNDYAYFFPSNLEHLRRLQSWLWALGANNGTLIGANIKFDLLYLRHCYPELSYIGKQHPPSMRLRDVLILSYLHNSQRSERSLKALTSLFGIVKYPSKVYDGLTRYPSHDDPDLINYNALDCAGTWHLYDTLIESIHRDFGPDSAKTSPYSFKWYSDLIWLLIHMTEAGVALDKKPLKTLHKKCEATCESIDNSIREKYRATVASKGSMTFATLAVERAAHTANLIGNRRLELSDKTKRVSTGKKNVKYILTHLPPEHPDRELLQSITDYRHHAKLLQTYLRPLLIEHPTKNEGNPIWLNGGDTGIVYPDWFATPSGVARGDRDRTEGGTLQARITCRRPGLQTYPSSMKEAFTSRFHPGTLFCADLSTIELRVAALLSGDPVLINVFKTGGDPHVTTASMLFEGRNSTLSPADQRQVGKKTNFLAVYGGGAGALQHALREVGLDYTWRQCVSFLGSYASNLPVLWGWRERTIEETKARGYVDIPLIGASRSLPGAGNPNKAYGKIAINFGPQAIAACILLSAASTFDTAIHNQNLRALTGLQIYDSMYVECPSSETETVRSLLVSSLNDPPYWTDLCTLYKRSIPLVHELTTKTIP